MKKYPIPSCVGRAEDGLPLIIVPEAAEALAPYFEMLSRGDNPARDSCWSLALVDGHFTVYLDVAWADRKTTVFEFPRELWSALGAIKKAASAYVTGVEPEAGVFGGGASGHDGGSKGGPLAGTAGRAVGGGRVPGILLRELDRGLEYIRQQCLENDGVLVDKEVTEYLSEQLI